MLSGDGTRLATVSSNVAQLWDATNGAKLSTIQDANPIKWATLSGDGTRLATGDEDKTVRIWDATTGAQLLIARNPKARQDSRDVVFSPDGTRLATFSGGNTEQVWVWDATTGAQLLQITHYRVQAAPNRLVGCLTFSPTFSPDGTRLATAGHDNTARVCDATTGAELLTVRHDGGVRSVAFSPDSTRLATGSEDTTARITPVI